MDALIGFALAAVMVWLGMLLLLVLIVWIASWPWATIFSIAAWILAAVFAIVFAISVLAHILKERKAAKAKAAEVAKALQQPTEAAEEKEKIEPPEPLPLKAADAEKKTKPHIKLKVQQNAPPVSQDMPSERRIRMAAGQKPIKPKEIIRLFFKVVFWGTCLLYWSVCASVFLNASPQEDDKVAWLLTGVVMFAAIPASVYFAGKIVWRSLVFVKNKISKSA